MPNNLYQKTRAKKREGFILLTVVFLIVFGSLLLVGTTRYTMQVTLKAKTLEADLQRKWGTVSIERAVLRNAPKLLNPQPGPTDSSANSRLNSARVFETRLGSHSFSIDLFDEQAKVNLSTILANRNEAYLEKLLLELCDTPTLSLAPLKDDPANLTITQFNSWGHVFDLGRIDPSQIHAFARRNLREITLWGAGGKLNFRSASNPSLKAILRLMLSPIEADRFITELDTDSSRNLMSIGVAAGLSDSELENLSRLLTPSSSTYSVWVTARDSGPQSTRCVVREAITGSQSRDWVFQW